MPHAGQTWYQWHAQYDDLHSPETDRLETVQDVLARVFDDSAAGPVTVVSICAGQSRDLIPVLVHHPRGADVTARLIERDALNVGFVLGALGSTSLTGVDVVTADAGVTDSYVGAVPADVVVAGGVFANIGLADSVRTVDMLGALCRPGGTVVWTSYGDGLVDADEVLALIETGPFERVDLRWGRSREFLVAAHRYVGPQRSLPRGRRFFEFGR